MGDAWDVLLTAFFVFAVFVLLVLVIAVVRGASLRSKAVLQSKPMASRASRSPQAASVAPAASPTRRRVISLHSTTPGQSPYEYNIGDNQGTRGSALVRAA